MNSKGQIPPVVLVFVLIVTGVILILVVKPSWLQTLKTSSNKPLSQLNETQKSSSAPVFSDADDVTRYGLINSLPDYLQRYYSDHKKYPDDLSLIVDWLLKHPNQELQQEGKILQTDLKSYKYKIKGSSYELSVILSNGTAFKAPSVDPRATDAMIKVDINNLAVAINIFYADNKRYPKTLEELKTIPDLSKLSIPNQPNGQPYSYSFNSNGYILSGKLSSGEEYKFENK